MDMQNVPVSRPAASAPAAAAVPATGISSFARAMNWCLALLVFAVPLLFLPFTAEVRELNKQTLIFLGVAVMLGIWVIRLLTTRSVSWVKTSLDYILLAYVLIYLLSSYLSLDKVSSFLGYYGRFTGSFLSVLVLVVLYYIVVNNVRTERVTKKLIDVLMLSGTIVMIYSLLQMLGVYIIRFGFAKAVNFNPIGSMVSLGIFSGLMMLFVQWSWFTGAKSLKRNIWYTIITLVGLMILFFINSSVAWLVLTVGMILFLALAMVMTNNQNNQMWLWKPLLVLVIGVLFVGFQFLPNSVNPRNWVSGLVKLPVEIQLSNSATWEMVKNAVTEKPILGFGPGTTGIAFGQIKPESLNQSIVWNLNFDRASSEIANLAIETGLLGVLAFEATSILFLMYALFFLLRRNDHPGRTYAFGLFIAWGALYLSHFFYFYNTTMYFMFWLLLGMFMAITHWKNTGSQGQGMSMANSPRSTLSWMFASLLILAVLLVGGFFEVAVYFADTAYASGLKELNKQQPDLARSNDLFLSAIRRNQYRDVYYLAYGQNIVFQAAQEVKKDNPDVSKFQNWVSELIQAGNSATAISPNKASNWSTRSQFFAQIRALNIPGTDDAIVSSAEEAIKRDSNSPVLYMQLAQAYVNSSETIDPSVVSAGTDTDGDGLSDQAEKDLGSNEKNSDSNGNDISDGDEVKAGFNPAGTGRLDQAKLAKFVKVDQDKLRKAEDALKKAIALKANLPDAYLALSRVYERWNKLEDAKKTLTDAVDLFPSNADLKYELGRIQFNLKDSVGAEKTFKQVIKLVPDHANAHYSLGLVALQKGDKTTALDEFKKTLEIVGSNADLEKAIKDLEDQISGKTVTPTPTPTPSKK